MRHPILCRRQTRKLPQHSIIGAKSLSEWNIDVFRKKRLSQLRTHIGLFVD